MSVTQTPEPVTILPRRKLGPFEALVVMEEQSVDTLEVTQHPVQEGAAITDHAFKQPEELTMRVVFDDAQRPLAETYARLRELQASREPFDVVTGKRIHRNMLMLSLSCTNDPDTESVLSLSITLQEVILVQVEVAVVPPRSRQAQPARTSGTQNAGTKAAQQERKPQRQQSILASTRPR